MYITQSTEARTIGFFVTDSGTVFERYKREDRSVWVRGFHLPVVSPEERAEISRAFSASKYYDRVKALLDNNN